MTGFDHHHGLGGHGHGLGPDSDRGRLALALALMAALMLVEVVVGALAHSLALVSDSAHMFTDAAAIAVALVAASLARRPAGGSLTYGLGRAEVLSAQFNGATLLVLGLVITYEGVSRLVSPPSVGGWAVVFVALGGIVINLAASRTLATANRKSLNVEGALQHVVTDLAAFVLTAVAGVVIVLTGFNRADGIASLIIAALMLAASYRLLRDSGRVFLEAAPKGVDPNAIGRALVDQASVREVHDLHVWEVTSGFTALSAHVLVEPASDCHEVRRGLESLLERRFAIEHTTLQVDHDEGRKLLDLELGDRDPE